MNDMTYIFFNLYCHQVLAFLVVKSHAREKYRIYGLNELIGKVQVDHLHLGIVQQYNLFIDYIIILNV